MHIGKEAVPRHRLQALLARGEFDRALELARAHSMDETEVHAARLLSMLRDAGAYIPSTGDGGGCVVPLGLLHARVAAAV